MAGYLPDEWNGRRVSVVLGTGGRFEAGLVDNNEGGINVEVVRRDSEEEPGRRAFLPWTAVRYVELLEVPEEEDDILIGRAE
jgi:hypothetical protein